METKAEKFVKWYQEQGDSNGDISWGAVLGEFPDSWLEVDLNRTDVWFGDSSRIIVSPKGIIFCLQPGEMI